MGYRLLSLGGSGVWDGLLEPTCNLPRGSRADALSPALRFEKEGKVPTCSCGAEIEFMDLDSGRKMPYRPDTVEKRLVRFQSGSLIVGKVVDTWVPHFVDCPDADKHRKDR